MISQQELAGSWNQIKGEIKSRWGSLTDNDLVQGEGNVEKLIGVIQQKTGSARRDVEEFIDRCVNQGSDLTNRLASTARQYSDQVGDALAQGYADVSERMQDGYQQAEDMIRTRPTESLSVAFGAGIITGILVSLLMRPSRS